MSQINISNLTFRYDNYGEDIFTDVSVILDTDWRLGLIGRNGRGKTTLLRILNKELYGSGNISGNINFAYFPMSVFDKNRKAINVIKEAIAPYELWEKQMNEYSLDESKIDEYSEVLERYIYNDGYIIEELIEKEMNLMGLDNGLLECEFNLLSGGEQTKLLIIALFLRANSFLLLDEPTNHLDSYGREIVANYLSKKSGFIVVSHDVAFVDKAVDHIISINRNSIEVQKGNFSTWKENKERQDNFEIAKNEKLEKDIDRLKKTAKEKARWSNKIEATKIGSGVYDRGFVGHKAAKMMKRAKSIENRQNKAIEEKSKLLKDIEIDEKLQLNQMEGHNESLIIIKDLSIRYGEKVLFNDLSFEVKKGKCVCLKGENGSGKSSVVKLLLGEDICYYGSKYVNKNISYISQNSSELKGSLKEYIERENIDEVLFKSNLRKLGFERACFDKLLEHWSEGQKKKAFIAKSLSEKAELYIWDEPLNFTDIITRTQIEKLIIETKPTMLIVEHDETFLKNIGAEVVEVKKFV